MSEKRLIGYGYVNEQGVATLEYDANDNEINGYVAHGSGELDLSASFGEMDSDDFVFLDCCFIDNGVSGDYSTEYYRTGSTSGAYVKVTDDYTILKASSSSAYHNYLNLPQTNKGSGQMYDWESGLCVEIDIISFSLGCKINLSTTTSSTNKALESIGATSNSHIRMEWLHYVDDDTPNVKYYVDGVLGYQGVYHYGSCALDLVVPSGGELRYKNLRVYQI